MTLLDKLSDKQMLLNAWTRLNKSNPNSHGLSGETMENFKDNLDTNIENIVLKIKNKEYKFSNVRGVSINKKNSNKKRPLKISDISDRIVAKAISEILEEKLAKEYVKLYNNNTSFAYINNRGIKDAWKEIVVNYNQGFKYILEVDIKNFFGSVDIEKLLQEKVFPFLPDKTLNELITDAISQNVGNLESLPEDEQKLFTNEGLPQGNALSPFLSNIYLYDFDRRFEQEQNMKLVRYADDFVVLCNSKNLLPQALSIAKEELETKLNLKIYDIGEKNDKGKEKTKIIENIHLNNLIFLSVRFDGKRIVPTKDKIEDIKKNIRELTTVTKDSNILNTFKKINNYLCGWLASYHFCNIDNDFENIDKVVNELLSHFLICVDWKLQVTSKQKKSKEKIMYSLTENQRKRSGVLTCKRYFEEVMKDRKVIIEDIRKFKIND